MDEGGQQNEEGGGGGDSASGSARWTCDACGCNTNTEGMDSCSVCGTSNSGPSGLRRHVRPNWFSRSVFGGGRGARSIHEEFGMDEEADLWESVVDDVELSQGEDRQNSIESLAMEVSGMASVARRSLESRRQGLEGGRQQRLLDVARVFQQQQQGNSSSASSSTRDVPRVAPEELWNLAMQNGPSYRPQWMNPSQMASRARNSNGIQIIPSQEPSSTNSLANLPYGNGEGRAIRASPAIPRDTSSRASPRRLAALQERDSGGNSRAQAEPPARKAFGFRVAFDHPSCDTGGNLGGCYLVGVTVSSFTAYGEQNALSQSAFFWGIEDGGNKYEGARYAQTSRGSRRLTTNYGAEIDPREVPMNENSLLFGSREVVTVIVDFDTRTMTFWRNSTLLGTLVSNLPRSGNLYPAVVPFNCGVSVAITGLDGDPLPLLRNFTADAKRIQREKEDAIRKEVTDRRAVLFRKKSVTPQLRNTLRAIFELYSLDRRSPLPYTKAACLFYRCGMNLNFLDETLKEGQEITFETFLDIVEKVLLEDADEVNNSSEGIDEFPFRVGDRVELVDGYEKYEDASGGPLRVGDRGTVVELQIGPNGERRSIRVLSGGRRWWYQPQAIVSERSGLIDSSGVWFVLSLLRAHGYDNNLESLAGATVSPSSAQIGDIVEPTDQSLAEEDKVFGPCIGRIAPDASTSAPSSSSGESSTVTVEFVNASFGAATGGARNLVNSSNHIERRKVRASKLLYTVAIRDEDNDDGNDDEEEEVEKMKDDESVADHDVISDKIRTDLAGVARLEGPSLESIMKECRKSPDSLAAMFSAGLPESLLKASDVAQRQMNSLEPREDLPERIASLGALVLFASDQLFSVTPRKYSGVSGDEGDMPQLSSSREEADNLPSRSNDEPRSQTRRSRRSASSARGQLVASIQQRRNFLLSLMSRGSSRGFSLEGSGLGGQELSLGSLPQALTRSGDSSNPHDSDGPCDESIDEDNEVSNEPPDSNNEEDDTRIRGASEDSAMSERTPFLDSIRRRRGAASDKGRARSAGSLQANFQRKLFEQGLLSNSLPWTSALIEDYASRSSHRTGTVLRHAQDEDGKSVLFLALAFGCSKAIIQRLVSSGAQVGAEEVHQAIRCNRADALGLLLRHACIPEEDEIGDLSEEVARVVADARRRQEALDKKMRDTAGNFMVDVLGKTIGLALQARRHSSSPRLELCSRVISECLIGNITLVALLEAQKDPSKKAEDEAEDEIALGAQSGGLLACLPVSILKQALFGDVDKATQVFLLLEDYLCSKELSFVAAGLTALVCMLKKFPQLCSSSEVERYGMLAFADFHHELCTSRCEEIRARQNAKKSDETSPSDSEDAPGSRTCIMCPNKHPATLHVTRHSSFRCDLCGSGVDRGRPMYGCRTCDWDACENCTDMAESGLIKNTVIRDIAAECRKLLTEVMDVDCEEDISNVLAQLASLSKATDLDENAKALLKYDQSAVEELASLIKTPGRISINQFSSIVLPAVHATITGNSSMETLSTGPRTKKAKIMESGKGAASQTLRSSFCNALVNLLVLQFGEKESRRRKKDDDESMLDSSELPEMSATQISIYAESSELLRRLQQVLSLRESVSSPALQSKRKNPNGTDLQCITTAMELELLPSNYTIPPGARNPLVLKAEPLLPLLDLESQVLRGCVPTDQSYLNFCLGLSKDKAIILERPRNSTDSWNIGQVLSFDEGTCTHGLRYANSLGKKANGSIQLTSGNPFDIRQIEFGSEVHFLCLSSRDYFVIHRSTTSGKAPSIRSSSRSKQLENLSSFVGKRVESNVWDKGWEPCTIVKFDGDGREAVCTVVSDSGVVTNGCQMSKLRGGGIPNSESDEGSDDGEPSRGRDAIDVVRAFPFFAARARGQEESRDAKRKAACTLKRHWSALCLTDKVSPVDVARPENNLSSATETEGKASVMTARVGDVEAKIIADLESMEEPPKLDVRFSYHKSLPGVHFNDSKNVTLVSAMSSWKSQHPPEKLAVGEKRKLYFTVSLAQNVASSETEAKPKAKTDFAMESATKSKPRKKHAKLTRQRSPPPANPETEISHSVCEGLDNVCMQCMEVIDKLAEIGGYMPNPRERQSVTGGSPFANAPLSKKLMEYLQDPLTVVGGVLPEWVIKAPSFAPRCFTYEARKALLESFAYGVSRSTFRLQESRINLGKLRQRMASLRARAVELVGEAFSGGAEDPTALQLQADELYGMEEALAARVRAMFRAANWKEHQLQVAKAAVRRDNLLSDAHAVMESYVSDHSVMRRRLEVRFENESGFDAASGDEQAGVTRGFYADVASALLSTDLVAGVNCSRSCGSDSAMGKTKAIGIEASAEVKKLPEPLWIPDMMEGVVIPTPRADEKSIPGLFPRPLPMYHPQMDEVKHRYRFMGRLFASGMRDGFMFPLPLSTSFLKLVQYGPDLLDSLPESLVLSSSDLPRPGFLGGEIYAAEVHICRKLNRLDSADPPLPRHELIRQYDELATDKDFARVAFGKTYDCSFDDWFQDKVFVDPLDPAQDENAVPLCPKGASKKVTVFNIREWVALAKKFFLHDGVVAQAAAFRQGIEDLFPAKYLRLFTAAELQNDVTGIDNVEKWDERDIRKIFDLGKNAAEALVAVAAIGGEGGASLSRRFGPSSPTIAFLTKALLDASPQQRRQFLSFVTSLPIVTKFTKIEVVPIVSPTGEFLPMSDPGCLPRANTCSRRLYIPRIEDQETFSKVLWAVVESESKFKGFYEWRG